MSLAAGFRHLGYGVGLGPLILVPHCSRQLHFNSFRFRTDRMPYNLAFGHLKILYEDEEGYTLNVYAASGKEEHTLHVHTAKMDTPYTSTLQ
jgi:hypothetical protein